MTKKEMFKSSVKIKKQVDIKNREKQINYDMVWVEFIRKIVGWIKR